MFGAGTDYCLLIVSRFRDELRRGGDVEAAMRARRGAHRPRDPRLGRDRRGGDARARLADFNATREMGPLLALGIVVMMACGLTLLPALLAVVRAPRVLARDPARGGGRAGRGHAAGRGSAGSSAAAPCCWPRCRPPCSSLGALGNLGGRGYLDLSEQYRDPPESVQGQELIRERFDPPGRVAPVDVVTATEVAIAGQGRAGAGTGRGVVEHRLRRRTR